MGFDHNWVLNKAGNEMSTVLRKVKSLFQAVYGNFIPPNAGIQFYAGNFLDGSIIGKDSTAYKHRMHSALKTQLSLIHPIMKIFSSTMLIQVKRTRHLPFIKFLCNRDKKNPDQ